MPIPWLTVLQAVPWGEVIRNAPKVADGAKTLWNKVATPAAGQQAPGPTSVAVPTMAQLQAELADLQVQMQAATQLIKELADQNTQLVRAVEVQRRQWRWLSGAVLLGGLVLVAWALLR